MKQTYQYLNDRVLSNGATWGILTGDAKLVYGISHGCQTIGEAYKVTRAEGNALYELDGRPVLDVLKEYLTPEQIGDWNNAVVNLALGLEPPPALQDRNPEFTHIVLHLIPSPEDARHGRVLLPREVSTGTSLWIMRRDQAQISKSLDALANRLLTKLEDRAPRLVLHFDCASRGQAIFRESVKSELLERLRNKICPSVPWFGFYTYGELCPIGKNPCAHCYTAVVAVISE